MKRRQFLAVVGSRLPRVLEPSSMWFGLFVSTR